MIILGNRVCAERKFYCVCLMNGYATRKCGMVVFCLPKSKSDFYGKPCRFQAEEHRTQTRHAIMVCLVPCCGGVPQQKGGTTMNHQQDEGDVLRARFTKWLDIVCYRAKLKYLQKTEERLETVSFEELPEGS